MTLQTTYYLLPVLFMLFLFAHGVHGQETDFSKVPGSVVAYSPATSEQFIGSPSICILPNGQYVASHDFFGPKSTEHVQAVSRVYSSFDKGQTWKQIAEIKGQFWSKLFTHQGNLFFLGTDRHHGNMIIRKSTDGGNHWTNPTDEEHGLIRAGEYHCAPTPIITHQGRLWRAMESAKAPTKDWGKRYSAMMMSVPEDADLLKADNWTESNILRYDSTFLDGHFGAWIEGNAVVTPEGKVVDLLRVDNTENNAEDMAAIVHISDDGKTATFDAQTGFIHFPGGSKKFSVLFDSVSGLYWTIANYIPESYKTATRPASIRNTQALCSSSDLKTWTVHQILLQHDEMEKHGFNYVDWVFEGKDIIFLSRTAYEDGVGGAKNFHDANFLTFHRVKNFRALQTKQLEVFENKDAVLPATGK